MKQNKQKKMGEYDMRQLSHSVCFKNINIDLPWNSSAERIGFNKLSDSTVCQLHKKSYIDSWNSSAIANSVSKTNCEKN